MPLSQSLELLRKPNERFKQVRPFKTETFALPRLLLSRLFWMKFQMRLVLRPSSLSRCFMV